MPVSVLDSIVSLRDRHSMYLSAATFETAEAVLVGMDLAGGGALLSGFREWLVVMENGPNDLGWPTLARCHISRRRALGGHPSDTEFSEFEALLNLVVEFLETRNLSDGARRIFFRYELWLREQDWYTPDSPGWLGANGDE